MTKLKPFLPHIIVVAVFFTLSAIYFYPLVFQGKTFKQMDIVQYQGMVKEISDLRKQYGEEPYWTNAMFGGMPNTMISMNQWGNFIKPIYDFVSKFPAYPSSLVFMGMISFYILMLAYDAPFLVAAIGAIGFSFASFTMISLEAGHNAKVACMMFMPLVLAGIVMAFRKNTWLGAAIFGIGLALQIVNNHVQITYYLFFIAIAIIISEFLLAQKSNQLKKFFITSAVLGGFAIVALGTHAGYFLSINEYSKYSIRGKTELTPLAETKEAIREDGLDRDYVFNYSNAIDEPFTFLIPDYYGGVSGIAPQKYKNVSKAMREQGYDPNQITSSLPSYFGGQPFVAGPIYLGAIVVFLFLLGMTILKSPIKWALFGVSMFGILMSYGSNFAVLNYLLFDYFPLYNKFRSVTMAVVIPQVCFSIIGVLGLLEIVNTKDKQTLVKPFYTASAIALGLLAFVFVIGGSRSYITAQELSAQLPNWILDAIAADRKAMRNGDTLRSLFFVIITIGLLFALIKDKLKQNIVFGAIALLSLIDLWWVNKRYLNDENFEKKVYETYYTPTEADEFILQDKSPNYRVYNLDNPFNDARTSYFHKSVGGYSPAKLRRYQDLIERIIANEQSSLIDSLKKGSDNFKGLNILNMLNTKYIIAGQDARSVIINDYALGNAWFVKKLKPVANPDEEIALLANTNTKEEAVINSNKFKVDKTEFALDSSSVVLKSFKPYDLTYTTNNSNDGFLVMSEVYYPKGWTATIDGKEAEIKQVNYVLRGLEVPAGNHEIRLVMVNTTHQTGNQIGMICSILLLGVVAFFVVKEGKNW